MNKTTALVILAAAASATQLQAVSTTEKLTFTLTGVQQVIKNDDYTTKQSDYQNSTQTTYSRASQSFKITQADVISAVATDLAGAGGYTASKKAYLGVQFDDDGTGTGATKPNVYYIDGSTIVNLSDPNSGLKESVGLTVNGSQALFGISKTTPTFKDITGAVSTPVIVAPANFFLTDLEVASGMWTYSGVNHANEAGTVNHVGSYSLSVRFAKTANLGNLSVTGFDKQSASVYTNYVTVEQVTTIVTNNSATDIGHSTNSNVNIVNVSAADYAAPGTTYSDSDLSTGGLGLYTGTEVSLTSKTYPVTKISLYDFSRGVNGVGTFAVKHNNSPATSAGAVVYDLVNGSVTPAGLGTLSTSLNGSISTTSSFAAKNVANGFASLTAPVIITGGAIKLTGTVSN